MERTTGRCQEFVPQRERTTRPAPGVRSTNGTNPRPAPGVRSTNGTNPRPPPGVRSTNGTNPRPVPGVRSTNGTNPRPTPGVRSTNGTNPRPKPRVRSTNGTNSRPVPEVRSTNGTNSLHLGRTRALVQKRCRRMAKPSVAQHPLPSGPLPERPGKCSASPVSELGQGSSNKETIGKSPDMCRFCAGLQARNSQRRVTSIRDRPAHVTWACSCLPGVISALSGSQSMFGRLRR